MVTALAMGSVLEPGGPRSGPHKTKWPGEPGKPFPGRCRKPVAKSRKNARTERTVCLRGNLSEFLAHEIQVFLPEIGHREIRAEAGCYPGLDFLDDDLGNRRQVELPRFIKIDPDQFDQLGIRAGDALDAAAERIVVDDEETRVEALRAPRRCDGTRDEGYGAEIGIDAMAGEFGPGAFRGIL